MKFIINPEKQVLLPNRRTKRTDIFFILPAAR